MAIASITAWLNNTNPSYLHGRMLYEQYGDDALVLTIIKNGSGPYHFSKLKAALEILNTKSNLQPKQLEFLPPAVTENQSIPTVNPLAPVKAKTNLDDAPPEIRAIRDEKNLKHATARDLHVKIRYMESAEHRLEAALKILNLMGAVNESWLAMDEWEKTGVITQVEKEEAIKEVNELSLQDLLLQMKNLPSSISKARSRYNGHEEPRKKTKALAKLTSLINRQEQVKRRLSELV